MKIVKILCFILLVAAGVFMVVYGEYDDSPGGQLLGVAAAAIGVWAIFRLLRVKQ